jgi:GT2 family glycosyltransferase
MTIGIGVTSYNRPEMLNKFLESLKKYSTYKHKLHVAIDTDEDRKGVAVRKNECLRALKDCDHIFLFDDDCWPIKQGWEDFFIKRQDVNLNHFLFLNDRLHFKTHTHMNTAHIYKECGGVFMYLSKKAVEAVGAFDEKFEKWGFEHADYSLRVHKSKWNWMPYLCLRGTEEYLYSEDYSNPNHKSSITNEEKSFLFKKNITKFNPNPERIYIPL